MSFGMSNLTNITMDNLTQIGNSSNFAEFMINVNNIIYSGWYMFFILWTLWVILYMAMQGSKDQPLINGMYGGAVITIISFLLRAVFVIQNGVVKGLLTDFQLWVFPLVTILLAAIIWAIKD